MDLDPFVPVGIDGGDDALPRHLPAALPAGATARPTRREEIAALGRNQQRVAARGREPGLLLERGAGEVTLRRLGRADRSSECAPIAEALDAAHGRQRLPRRAAHARAGRWATPTACRRRACWRRCARISTARTSRFTRAQSAADAQPAARAAVDRPRCSALRGDGRPSRWPSRAAHRGRRHHALRDLPPGLPVARPAGHLSPGRMRGPCTAPLVSTAQRPHAQAPGAGVPFRAQGAMA